MKNSNQLLIISSIATGAILIGKPVYAQQVTINNVPKQLIYNDIEYLNKSVKLNNRSDIVKHIQSTLNSYFGAGLAEDGIYGKLTKEAVENAQRRLKVEVDGIFGCKTAKALLKHALANPIDKQDGFSQVPTKIQNNFTTLGYNIKATGSLSSYDTILAIRDFQRKNRLPVTGKVDLEVLNKMNEKIKEHEDEIKKFKSDTNYYISVNSLDHTCIVYQKIDTSWEEIRRFNILSGNTNKGTYKLGIKGKELNLSGIPMKNFTQIDGLNVFYSAVADAGYGLRVSYEDTEFIGKMPQKTTVKIY
ncbi:peptidoglycan-binding protein [Clostridium sp. DJ247]|uniref:peptidoglycan-binding domain-containing protein n=1 Tax=Clostridium sp. DJ247 TaxID=2726188 RepID=UPI00162ACB0F|nr:peptidoglycan-binding protein [Clostridium sp. DJ247]MBC2582082.1 peptidoglycan-binding protein [Clostridium sp. DJ247]